MSWLGLGTGGIWWAQDQEEGTVWGTLVHGSQVSVTQLTALAMEKMC